jgi:Nitrile hydratase beta subunit, N-terminal
MSQSPQRGVHDLGGQPGDEPVDRGPHHDHGFEARTYALLTRLRHPDKRLISVDEMRRGIESLSAEEYGGYSYYERWLESARRILLEKGVLDEAELTRKIAEVQRRFAGGAAPAAPAAPRRAAAPKRKPAVKAKIAAKAAPKRKAAATRAAAKRTTAKRKVAPKRSAAKRKAAPKRAAAAKRPAAKRSTAKRKTAPKRAATKRKAAPRRTAAPKRKAAPRRGRR